MVRREAERSTAISTTEPCARAEPTGKATAAKTIADTVDGSAGPLLFINHYYRLSDTPRGDPSHPVWGASVLGKRPHTHTLDQSSGSTSVGICRHCGPPSNSLVRRSSTIRRVPRRLMAQWQPAGVRGARPASGESRELGWRPNRPAAIGTASLVGMDRSFTGHPERRSRRSDRGRNRFTPTSSVPTCSPCPRTGSPAEV